MFGWKEIIPVMVMIVVAMVAMGLVMAEIVAMYLLIGGH
jgi:hypothetical protein